MNKLLNCLLELDFKNEEWFSKLQDYFRKNFHIFLSRIINNPISNVEKRLYKIKLSDHPRRAACFLYREGYVSFEEWCSIMSMLQSEDKDNTPVAISILEFKLDLYNETRLI